MIRWPILEVIAKAESKNRRFSYRMLVKGLAFCNSPSQQQSSPILCLTDLRSWYEFCVSRDFGFAAWRSMLNTGNKCFRGVGNSSGARRVQAPHSRELRENSCSRITLNLSLAVNHVRLTLQKESTLWMKIVIPNARGARSESVKIRVER